MITTRCRDALVGKRPRQGPRAEASGAQRAGTRARALSGRMRERGALEQRRGACCAGTGLSYRRASLAGTVGRKGQVRRAEAGVRRVPGTVCWGSSRCILRATTAQRRPAGPKRRPPVRRGCRTAPVPCAPHALPTPNSRGFHCDGNHSRAFKHRFSFVRYSESELPTSPATLVKYPCLGHEGRWGAQPAMGSPSAPGRRPGPARVRRASWVGAVPEAGVLGRQRGAFLCP